VLGQALGAVAGDEAKRQVAALEDLGDRKHLLAVNVDVENGQIDLGRSGLFLALGNAGRNARHLEAKLFEHVFQQQPDQIFVFNDKDASGHVRSIGWVLHRNLKTHKSTCPLVSQSERRRKAERLVCL